MISYAVVREAAISGRLTQSHTRSTQPQHAENDGSRERSMYRGQEECITLAGSTDRLNAYPNAEGAYR